MMQRKLRVSLATMALLAAAPLAMAACSNGAAGGQASGGAPASSAPASSAPASSAPASSAPASSAPASSASASTGSASAPFGPGCAAVPATGKGSFDGMSQGPVATAASNNKDLSTLVTAVTAAKLGDTLNSQKAITVFAPDNEAFKAMDQPTLKKALADPTGLLTKVLTYHVIAGRISPDKLAGDHKTLNGATVTVAGSDKNFTVNGKAKVVCGNVQTANATVYIISGVLLPKS